MPTTYDSSALGLYVLWLSGAMIATALLPRGAIGVLFQSNGLLSSSLAVILLFCCDVWSMLRDCCICRSILLHIWRGGCRSTAAMDEMTWYCVDFSAGLAALVLWLAGSTIWIGTCWGAINF